jgi:D-alanyl-lipoteichoic acid acyltransferase DltB (MBOAT superfamily)
MLFNSFDFIVFFVIVYLLYLFSNHKYQNILLLIASYIFYGWWDWRFLSLLFITTAIDYYCGLKIYNSSNQTYRKRFLILSIATHLVILGFFKYFNFFTDSFQSLTNIFGIKLDFPTLNIILPVGISFYTFQSMSYTIDLYRKELTPAKNFFDFALFVSFFPQLVAGPIERAKHLLPQVASQRRFSLDQIYEGAYLVLWGYFEKLFVADNLSGIVDPIFSKNGNYNGMLVLIALYAFAFQIFCDFDGYSNIGRGIAKWMGFELKANFKLPYFSKNPTELWQRWHITLSSWLRDYIYKPIRGDNRTRTRVFFAALATFLLGGLWHGANWTYVVWGLYHFIILFIYRISGQLFPRNDLFRSLIPIRIFTMFHLWCLGILLFRSNSLHQAKEMFLSMFVKSEILNENINALILLLSFIIMLLLIQMIQYRKGDLFTIIKLNPAYQTIIYFFILCSILFLGVTSSEKFVYFQF